MKNMERIKLTPSLFESMGFKTRSHAKSYGKMFTPGKYIMDREIVVAKSENGVKCTERISVWLNDDGTYMLRHEYMGDGGLSGDFNLMSRGANHSYDIKYLDQYLEYLDERRCFVSPVNNYQLTDDFFLHLGYKYPHPRVNDNILTKSTRMRSGTFLGETCLVVKISKRENIYMVNHDFANNKEWPELEERGSMQTWSGPIRTANDYYQYLHERKAITR